MVFSSGQLLISGAILDTFFDFDKTCLFKESRAITKCSINRRAVISKQTFLRLGFKRLELTLYTLEP